MSGSVILRIDLSSDTFQKTWRKLDPQVQKAAKKIFGELSLLDIANAPHKLHLHTLTAKKVKSAVDPTKTVSVYTFHIAPDDKFKASFTFEGGTAYMRVCGEHDWVDDHPGG
jgi:hypothetical protein